MLDLWLEAAYEKSKVADGQARYMAALERLPVEELLAITRGESPLNKLASDDDGPNGWLNQFAGSPLYDKALAIERQNLELDMKETTDRAERSALREGDSNQKDVLRVQRRMLELELAESQNGGGESEPQMAAPPGAPVGVSEDGTQGAGAETMNQTQASPVKSASAVQAVKNVGQLAGHGARVAADKALTHLGEHPLASTLLFAGGTHAGAAGQRAEDRKNEKKKTAAELTESNREHLKAKSFAIPPKKGGEGHYPIEDKAHASNALARVDQFGNSGEKSKVYSAVAKKYPALAARSDVAAVKDKVKAAELDPTKVAGMRFGAALTKQALGLPPGIGGAVMKGLGAIGGMAAKNPTAAAGLAGAGLGAMAGGPGHRLSGAVAGGALGAGAGFAAPKMMQGMQNGLGFGDAAKAVGQQGLNQAKSMFGNAVSQLPGRGPRPAPMMQPAVM